MDYSQDPCLLLVLIRPEEVKTGSQKTHLCSSVKHNSRDVEISERGVDKFSEHYSALKTG